MGTSTETIEGEHIALRLKVLNTTYPCPIIHTARAQDGEGLGGVGREARLRKMYLIGEHHQKVSNAVRQSSEMLAQFPFGTGTVEAVYAVDAGTNNLCCMCLEMRQNDTSS